MQFEMLEPSDNDEKYYEILQAICEDWNVDPLNPPESMFRVAVTMWNTYLATYN